MQLNKLFFVCLVLCLTSPLSSPNGFAQTDSVKVELDNRSVVGRALGYDGKQLALLLRDGQIQLFPTQADKISQLGKPFKPYSMPQLKKAFFDEFKTRYDVSTTDNFVVVHPWGDATTWAFPFDDFHRRFVSFFEDRGFEIKEPEIPLIAMVLRSRNDFDRSLINEVQRHDSRIAGYYSRITNRITTYDPAGQLRLAEDRWMYSSWAIIHEATHQSAFNSGVHNRFAPPPLWLAEGLATMFEARGVNDHEKFTKASDRVNRRRLGELRKFLDTPQFYDGLVNLIANDKLYFTHLEMAYGISWGLVFYLSETQPKKFYEFIAKDAKRKNFQPYSSEQRLRDFAKAFGNDFEKLATDLQRYYRKK